MLSFPSSVRIFLATGVTDMRKSFDGLAALARDALDADPRSGAVFVFCNRRRDRLKVLIWDRDGFWLCAKRLEGGTFRWPQPQEAADARRVEMTNAQLSALIEGIDLKGARRRPRWSSEQAQSA